VVFKLCAAALWGAVRNSKGAANQNLAAFSIKSCLMLFIIKKKQIFFTNSPKASRSEEFLHPFQVFAHIYGCRENFLVSLGVP
jgi:hypothetical protein